MSWAFRAFSFFKLRLASDIIIVSLMGSFRIFLRQLDETTEIGSALRSIVAYMCRDSFVSGRRDCLREALQIKDVYSVFELFTVLRAIVPLTPESQRGNVALLSTPLPSYIFAMREREHRRGPVPASWVVLGHPLSVVSTSRIPHASRFD